MLISFLCDYDNKNLYFFNFSGFYLLFQFCSFWLLSKFGNMVIQLKFDVLCMLSGPEKMFLFPFFQQNSRWPTNHMLLWRAWTASPICFKEATYPGHMLIGFWRDSEITFSRGLHKNLVTVLYFSIINVLCGASGDASFAPQANLVYAVLEHISNTIEYLHLLCKYNAHAWSKK